MPRNSRVIATSLTAIALACGPTIAAATGELNLYSSRHYDTDERLYSDFTEATGITINRIEGKADELIARMEAEGVNSPADVLLTVDTSRLERAKTAGVLQQIDSAVLETRVPANLQDEDNQWFGFSQRARIIFYDKADVAEPPMSYVDLADPKYAGQVCHRSSTNVYSQTLLAGTEHPANARTNRNIQKTKPILSSQPPNKGQPGTRQNPEAKMTKNKKTDDQKRNACCRREIMQAAMMGLVETEIALEHVFDRLGRGL